MQKYENNCTFVHMTDLAIIGGGPAGYTAAEKAASAGLEVTLFEDRALGGVCLNEGCIPTKTMLYSAKLYDQARHSEKYGINTEAASFDYATILKRKTKVIRKLGGGIKVRMRNAGVTVVEARAEICGRTEGGFTVKAAEQTVEARSILVCTGSQAVISPIPGLDASSILTNREILELQEVPQRLTIIGGGVIGMEFASLMNSLGSKVTVIEMQPKILAGIDPEISAMLRNIYTSKGVEFHLGSKVTAIEGDTVAYLTPEGETARTEPGKILLSVGRRANIKGIGLENLGIECGRGINTDSHMRTNIPGVYAAGDVTGFSQLAHTAIREAEVAVDNILGKDTEMKYDAIPGVVYTNPEVAGVGLTESQAAADGQEISVARLPMQYSGRFVAENEAGEGICKMIFDPHTRRLLGVHMMGNPCSEIIPSACIAITNGLTAEDFARTVLPHPSVSEILKETASCLK